MVRVGAEVVAAITALLALTLHAGVADGAPTGPTPGPCAIRLQKATPFERTYFDTRARAEADSGGAASEPVAAAHALAVAIAGAPGWGMLDARAVGCGNAGELVARFQALPESLGLAAGRIALHEPALAFARALAHMKPVADSTASIDAAMRRLESECRALDGAFREVCAAFELAVPDSVHVLLGAHAPRPGAVTLRTSSGPVCVVGVADMDSTLLEEAVLHEATHAADVATTTGVLADLRAALERAGIARTDRRYRDAVHTLFFVQAGETVRRRFSRTHVDYGDARGYYARVGPLADAVRHAWTAHLHGGMVRDEALRAIVAAAASP